MVKCRFGGHGKQHDAASTYNMLTEEGRKVAAILIPAEPTPKKRYTPDELQRLLSGQA